jgi:hypothetical protein
MAWQALSTNRSQTKTVTASAISDKRGYDLPPLHCLGAELPKGAVTLIDFRVEWQ